MPISASALELSRISAPCQYVGKLWKRSTQIDRRARQAPIPPETNPGAALRREQTNAAGNNPERRRGQDGPRKDRQIHGALRSRGGMTGRDQAKTEGGGG